MTSLKTIKKQKHEYPIFVKYYLHKNKDDRRVWQEVFSDKHLESTLKDLKGKGYNPTIDSEQKKVWQVLIFSKFGRSFNKVTNVSSRVKLILEEWKEIGTVKLLNGSYYIKQISLNAFYTQLRKEKVDFKEICTLKK